MKSNYPFLKKETLIVLILEEILGQLNLSQNETKI